MSKVDLLKYIYTGGGSDTGHSDPEDVLSRVIEHLSDDFTVFSPGQSPIAGTFVGLEEFLGHLKKMQSLCSGSFHEELEGTFLADDKFGMVVHRLKGEREGKTLDTWGFGLFRFEDDKVVAHWECVGDQQQWDNFWS